MVAHSAPTESRSTMTGAAAELQHPTADWTGHPDPSGLVGDHLQQIHARDDAHRILPLCHDQPVNMPLDHDACDLRHGCGHRYLVDLRRHDVTDGNRPFLDIALAEILEREIRGVIAIETRAPR